MIIRKGVLVLSIWGAFFALFLFLLFYLEGFKEIGYLPKNFVKLTGLPDAPFVTEARYIRHRSITDIYPIFDFSPEVGEIFPFSFAYGCSPSYRGSKWEIKHERD